MRPGDADIETEFSSPENTFFVLHDSIGFEPGANDTFDTVERFIVQRSQDHLDTKDRLHAIWSVTFSIRHGSLLQVYWISGFVRRRQ